MIIYKDILAGDELISDVYPLKDAPDAGGCLWEIDGAMVKPGQEEIVLAGANASAEGEDADEGGDASNDNPPEFNLALSFRYQKIPAPTSDAFKAEMKKYVKNVLKAMTAKGKSKEDIDAFQKGAGAALKKLTKNHKNYDFYIGEGSEPSGTGESMYVLVDFREDGTTPYATIWKHALVEEKV